MPDAGMISIIMPVYNRAALIGRSIQSVLNQTHQAYELIVADDGSTDDTVNAIRKQFSDPRIRILNLPHQGVAMTRNAAIQAAEGDYLCFLDSDDWWPSDKLKRQLKVMQDTSSMISIGDFADVKYPGDPHPKIRHVPQTITYDRLLVDNSVLFQTLMARRQVRSDLVFEPVRHEDFLLALTLLKKGYTFTVIPDILAYRLRHADSLSSDKIRSAVWRHRLYRRSLNLRPFKALCLSVAYLWFAVFRSGRRIS